MSPDLIAGLLFGAVGVVSFATLWVSVHTLLETRRMKLKEAYDDGYNTGKVISGARVPRRYGVAGFGVWPVAPGEHFDEGDMVVIDDEGRAKRGIVPGLGAVRRVVTATVASVPSVTGFPAKGTPLSVEFPVADGAHGKKGDWLVPDDDGCVRSGPRESALGRASHDF